MKHQKNANSGRVHRAPQVGGCINAALPCGDGGWLDTSAAVCRNRRSACGTASPSRRSRTGDDGNEIGSAVSQQPSWKLLVQRLDVHALDLTIADGGARDSRSRLIEQTVQTPPLLSIA